MNLVEELNSVFREVFDDPSIEVKRELTAADVDDWDSITHINLICAVEEKFGVSFTTRETASLNNVGDLMDLVARKTGNA